MIPEFWLWVAVLGVSVVAWGPQARLGIEEYRYRAWDWFEDRMLSRETKVFRKEIEEWENSNERAD